MPVRDDDPDWFEENAPAPAGPPAPPPLSANDEWARQVNALYMQYRGVNATQAEIDAHRGNPGGIGAIEQLLKDYNAAHPPPKKDEEKKTETPGPTPPPPIVGVPKTGFGSPPPPYQSNPNAPTYTPLPTYTPPKWEGGDFVNPTQAEVEATPGYQTRLEAGLQARNRAAAANGTIYNGGTLKALSRYGQDYAQNEYQTARTNSYENYKQRYSQFQDAAGMDLGARTLNANENDRTYQNRYQSYLSGNSRTLSDYLTNLTTTRNSELDYWNRLMDLNNTGANTAQGSR